MIPASYNRASWSLFQREMRNFFTGAKSVSMAEVSFKNGGSGGSQFASGDWSGKLFSVYDPRGHNFKLTPASLALRVCKPEGERRIVTCLGAKDFRWPKVLSGGLEVTKQTGSEKGLCFGERDNSTVVLGENGEKWSNPIAELVSLSHLDGVELLHEGLDHVLLQWKHNDVNLMGFFRGEDESGFLECSPLSKWDPNEQKELEVIQEGDKGEVQGLAVKNSKNEFVA
nr:hypothetical protein CFP56_71994 [Quercus suber]